MSEIQFHAHINKNTKKHINLTANNCENCNAQKFNFDKFTVKYSSSYALNGCVDSMILTKPNTFVTINKRDFKKLEHLATQISGGRKK